jgi:MFS family permease
MSDVKKLHVISLVSGLLFYTPIMTLLLLQQNISVGLLVGMQTVFSIAMMVSELPTGVLADRFGQKVSIRLGLVLDALSMLSLLFVDSALMLAAFFAVRGVSVAFRSGSDEALFYESYISENKSKKGYSRAFARFLGNDVLGFIIAATVAGIAVQIFGSIAYAPLVVATSIATILALGITFTLKGARVDSEVKEDFRSLTHIKSSFAHIKSSRTIFALTLAGLLTLNGEYFLRQSYQPYFNEMVVPSLFLGVALGMGKLFNYAVIRNVHVLEKYLSVDQIIFWINATTGALFIAFAMTKDVWLLVPIFVLIQGLLNAERPVVSDYINQRVESFQRSTVLSGISLTLNFGQIFARLGLALSLGMIGLGKTYILQGVYMLIGSSIAVWYLRKCGCTHRVKPTDSIEDIQFANEV